MLRYRYSRVPGQYCSESGCDEELHCRGLCRNHYQSQRRRIHRRKTAAAEGRPFRSKYNPRIKCSIEGCETHASARGWCYKHYKRFTRYGDPLKDSGHVPNKELKCTVEGCARLQRAQGYCTLHYRRWRETGSPGPVGAINRRINPVVCSIEGCETKQFSRGVCHKHYRKLPKIRIAGLVCSVIGCGRPHEAKSYCDLHYNRFCRHGDPLKGARKEHPIGTRIIDPNGYVIIKVGIGEFCADFKGWADEHRYVMAQHLGRDLLPGENVHHVYGDRANNEILNLELWSSSQPSGQRVSDKVEWARAIIALYGESFPAK